MEFVVPTGTPDSFFPIQVAFTARQSYCGIEIVGASVVGGDAPVKFSTSATLTTDCYEIK